MNNCITHHCTSPFNNAALTPPPSAPPKLLLYFAHLAVRFEIRSADVGGGGEGVGTVGWSFLHHCTHTEAHLVVQGDSGIVLWCRVRRNASCAGVRLSMSICVRVGVYARV